MMQKAYSTIYAILMSALQQARLGRKSDSMIAASVAEAFLQSGEESEAITSSSDHRRSSRTTAAYFRLLRGMLGSVRKGASRSQFLATLFKELETDGDNSRTLMLLEGISSGKGGALAELSAPHIAGMHPERAEAFRRALAGMGDSDFLRALLIERKSFDFDLKSQLASRSETELERYAGEFDIAHASGNSWICASPLPASESGEPERSLVAIYPLETRSGRPSIPAGAYQEWDILELAPLIFRLLQHQTKTLRDHVADEQRRLIMELAPSAMAHELGTSFSLMSASLQAVSEPLAALGERLGWEDPELLLVAHELERLLDQIRSSRNITEAFTNLERRNPKTELKLATLVREIQTVLLRRLMALQIHFRIAIPEDLVIVTDTRYVGHVLMNVAINAIEAIEMEHPGAKANERPPRYITFEASDHDGLVEILIANDGPPVPISLAARVFEKGVTTKPAGVGHGQGLYLCRQIATHLEGSIIFSKPPLILPHANVTFKFTIPKIVKHETDQ